MATQPERFNSETGEILPALGQPADGFAVPIEARSAGNLLDQMEDGKFSAEVYHEMKALGKFLGDRAKMTEKPAKGKVTIEIDMEADGDSFRIQSKYKIKKPEVSRPRSVSWQDEGGNFTRFPPNQMQMFNARNVADEQRGPVRSI